MKPMLRSGDIIFAKSSARKIQRGDIVVFSPPGEERFIIHRVVSITASGIKTRGDNNCNIDPGFLSPENVIGKVEYIQRSGKRISLLGGFWGQIYVYFLRVIFRSKASLIIILHPAYHWFSENFILRHSFTSCLKNRIFAFYRPTGTELKLFLGRHVIATLLPQAKRWQIQRPFRLFVDDSLLPVCADD